VVDLTINIIPSQLGASDTVIIVEICNDFSNRTD